MDIIQAQGYKESTYKFGFRNGRFSSLRKFFSDREREEFDVSLAREYIAEIQKIYESGRNTGLRIGDIIKIKLMDINWKTDELTVVQSKTGNLLVLPLESDTELAIIDYMQNGRPDCGLLFLFLRHYTPYNMLSQQMVTCINLMNTAICIFRKTLH